MQITWYGHSAFRLDFGGHAVLIDPFFTGNPAFACGQALLQARYCDPLPLRLLPHNRSKRRQIHRRNARPRHQGGRAGEGQAVSV
jgi:hypothetical protein